MKTKTARRRGLPLPEMETPQFEPEEEAPTDFLPSHLLWIWEAFAVLSRTRVVNQAGPQPILTSEVLAYCHMQRILSEYDQRDLLFHLTALDIVWLKDQFAKIEKRHEEAKKEAEKNRKKPRGRNGRV